MDENFIKFYKCRPLTSFQILILQRDNENFNKGLLMNLGFEEAVKTNDTDCVVCDSSNDSLNT